MTLSALAAGAQARERLYEQNKTASLGRCRFSSFTIFYQFNIPKTNPTRASERPPGPEIP